MGFEDGPIPDMDLLVVIPGTTTDLAAAAVFTPNDQFDHGAPGFPALLADGSLAMVAVVNYGTGDSSDRFTAHWGTVEVFDIASAHEIDALQFPELHSVDLADEVVTHTVDVASRPTTNGLAIVAQDWTDPMSPTFILYRWDGGTELREIARGIAAVAW